MANLAQVMINLAEQGQPFSATEISRFAPEEFRTAIQALMGEGRDALAYALGDAGLALYPESEDILAITSLLAVVREFIEPAMSRSALDRLLRRRGVNRLPEPEVEKTQVKSLSRRC